MLRKLAVILAITLSLAACTDEKKAQRVLEESGFTHVETTGYRWFACSKDDDRHTGFKATGPTGRPVEGVVCSPGWFSFKNSTVRLD